MSDLDEFILYRTLRHKFYVEHASMAHHIEDSDQPFLKNVCCKTTVEISDRLDAIVGILDISKRSFIERALLHAIESAEREFERVISEKWTSEDREQMAIDHKNEGVTE